MAEAWVVGGGVIVAADVKEVVEVNHLLAHVIRPF
jgi:hypothetical protein